MTSTERKSVVMIFVLSLTGLFLELLSVGLVLPALTLVLQGSNSIFFSDNIIVANIFSSIPPEKITELVLFVLISVFIAKTIFYAFIVWKQSYFSFDLLKNLSHRMFSGYLNKEYSFHLQHNSSELLNNSTNEVGMLVKNFITPTLSLITEALILIGLSVLLVVVEPVGSIIVFSLLAVSMLGIYYATEGRLVKWGEQRQYHQQKIIQNLQQGLSAIKDIKIRGCEEEFISRYEFNNENNIRVARNQTVVQQLPRLWLEFVVVFAIVGLVSYMNLNNYKADDILPVLGVYAAAAFRMLPSANRVMTAIQTIKYGIPVVNVLYDEYQRLDAEFKLKEDSKTELNISGSELNISGSIELKNIDYKYPDSSVLALDGISLNINIGNAIGIIGSSGSGKSTLVDMILGLLNPSSGMITVSGRDIHNNVRQWRDHIGYVPQKIYLIDDTLSRNIAFGVPDNLVDNESLNNAIIMAQLNELVDQLPNGLNTIIGEHGVRLSGGQCQRIGIARALYHKPSVLVLDEATSSLDVETEEKVMESIDALCGIITVIIVAHRLSTLKKCDFIFEIEKGKIINKGSYRSIHE